MPEEIPLEQKETTLNIKESERISFDYGEETHYITIVEIIDDKVKVIITSEPIELTLILNKATINKLSDQPSGEFSLYFGELEK